MDSHRDIVIRAIGERIKELQARVAVEAVRRDKEAVLLRRAAEWEAVPADIDDEMVSAIIVKIETDPFAGAAFKKEFLEDFKRFITDLRKNDIMRLARVAEPALERIDNPPVKPEYPRLELIAVPPEKEGGEWHLIAAPLEVTADYGILLPQSARCDVALAMEVAPRANDNLAHSFNIPGIFIPAGAPAKPLVLAYKPDKDGIKTMLVTGRTGMYGEVRQQIVANQPFRAGASPAVLDKSPDRRPVFPLPLV